MELATAGIRPRNHVEAACREDTLAVPLAAAQQRLTMPLRLTHDRLVPWCGASQVHCRESGRARISAHRAGKRAFPVPTSGEKVFIGVPTSQPVDTVAEASMIGTVRKDGVQIPADLDVTTTKVARCAVFFAFLRLSQTM